MKTQDYIEVGGLKWALQNAGTDVENPNGKLYTWDEAMKLENKTWRVPSKSQWSKFIKRTLFSFDEKRGVGVFTDRKNGARIDLSAVGFRNTSGTLSNAGTWGYYWSSVVYSSDNAYYMYFGSSDLRVDWRSKQYGRSIRLVRRGFFDSLIYSILSRLRA